MGGGGGGSQRLLSLNPTTFMVHLLLGLWLMLGCDNKVAEKASSHTECTTSQTKATSDEKKTSGIKKPMDPDYKKIVKKIAPSIHIPWKVKQNLNYSE